jgi:hypothetical protein
MTIDPITSVSITKPTKAALMEAMPKGGRVGAFADKMILLGIETFKAGVIDMDDLKLMNDTLDKSLKILKELKG